VVVVKGEGEGERNPCPPPDSERHSMGLSGDRSNRSKIKQIPRQLTLPSCELASVGDNRQSSDIIQEVNALQRRTTPYIVAEVTGFKLQAASN
jgi:hypothetical protein